MGYKPETIKLLAEINIRRYTSRIRRCTQMLRVDECQMYLNLWNKITEKVFLWDMLDPRERQEVREAAMDEGIKPDLGKV